MFGGKWQGQAIVFLSFARASCRMSAIIFNWYLPDNVRRTVGDVSMPVRSISLKASGTPLDEMCDTFLEVFTLQTHDHLGIGLRYRFSQRLKWRFP